MPLHNQLSGSDLHGILAYVFADEAAMAAVVVASPDIGKVALRQSDVTVWLLASVDPLLWVPISAPVVVPSVTTLVGITHFSCPGTLQVGDFVYLESEDTVGLAVADSINTMPCIGVVQSKPTPTTCVVQYVGDVTGFTDLVPDTTYYISPSGGVRAQNTPPEPAPGQTVVLQKVGTARNTTTLILSVDATDYVVMQG